VKSNLQSAEKKIKLFGKNLIKIEIEDVARSKKTGEENSNDDR
jgi:hypothetical protein